MISTLEGISFVIGIIRGPGPVSEDVIQMLKRHRMKEKELNSLMHEIMIYLVLLLLVWSISYGNRDHKSYQISANVINNIVDDVPTSQHIEGFAQVCFDKSVFIQI